MGIKSCVETLIVVVHRVQDGVVVFQQWNCIEATLGRPGQTFPVWTPLMKSLQASKQLWLPRWPIYCWSPSLPNQSLNPSVPYQCIQSQYPNMHFDYVLVKHALGIAELTLVRMDLFEPKALQCWNFISAYLELCEPTGILSMQRLLWPFLLDVWVGPTDALLLGVSSKTP